MVKMIQASGAPPLSFKTWQRYSVRMTPMPHSPAFPGSAMAKAAPIAAPIAAPTIRFLPPRMEMSMDFPMEMTVVDTAKNGVSSISQ